MALPTRGSRFADYDQIELAQRQFDTVIGRLFTGRAIEPNGWAPYGVDVREDVDHVYVEAELPGFQKENVDITLVDSTLTISAERKEPAKEGNGKSGAGSCASGVLTMSCAASRFRRRWTKSPSWPTWPTAY